MEVVQKIMMVGSYGGGSCDGRRWIIDAHRQTAATTRYRRQTPAAARYRRRVPGGDGGGGEIKLCLVGGGDGGGGAADGNRPHGGARRYFAQVPVEVRVVGQRVLWATQT